jgi:hypothetical protein
MLIRNFSLKNQWLGENENIILALNVPSLEEKNQADMSGKVLSWRICKTNVPWRLALFNSSLFVRAQNLTKLAKGKDSQRSGFDTRLD